MAKIGICTVYKGFNYGSSLQALASKIFIEELGYSADIIDVSGSFLKGRDIRPRKLINLCLRMIRHPIIGYKWFKTARSANKNSVSESSKALFLSFFDGEIKPSSYSYGSLKQKANSDEYFAFVCGSDQVWNASSLYVDPFYYLRFSPQRKRVAFAPSFGREQIPNYNQKIIKNYILGFNYLSARETSGVEIIQKLCGKKAIQIVDPTLLLDKSIWIKMARFDGYLPKKYILAYFLNAPSNAACKKIQLLKKNNNQDVVAIIKSTAQNGWKVVDAGPREFLHLIHNANYIVTDSFHGVAFSLKFNKEFFVYSRNYGTAANQSTRITSLLEKIGLTDRLDNTKPIHNSIDYNSVNVFLMNERNKAKDYLLSSFNKIA